MRLPLRSALPVIAIAASILAPQASSAAPDCPAPACITISGDVRGPAFEAVPDYRVLIQRADGYNVTVATDSAGRFQAAVPVPSSSSSCYQIVGQADAFYANSRVPSKQCTSGSVTLSPKVRLQDVLGEHKVYIRDAAPGVTVPVEVSALSRTYPAPFDGQALPWVADHQDPLAEGGSNEEGHHEGESGTFGAPSVRLIAPGVWQYRWTETLRLDRGPGFYDMDWGRGASPFDPMMECKMVWFGYGIDSMSPSKAVTGSTITLSGQRFGARPGSVVLKGSGQVTTITGSNIVSWSDTSVTFIVPPLSKTGWAAIVPPSNVASNATYVDLDPVKIRLP